MWKKKLYGPEELDRGPSFTGTRPNDVPGDPYVPTQWHLINAGQSGGTPGLDIDVVRVWNDYTGQGVRVGVIDDGFDYTHPDLLPNFDQNADFDFRAGDTDAGAQVGDSHGTAVAGVIAADDNGVGTVGVAPDATIVGARVGYGANGTLSQFAQAIRSQVSVDVSNNSWSYETPFIDDFRSAAFAEAEAALEHAAANGRGGLGTVFVFAAGNARFSGDDVNFHNFQNSIHTISVASVDHAGKVAASSTPGEAILVAAPGVNISTIDGRGSTGYVAGDYVTISGTSFAAPVTAGVVALMLDANPALGYRDVQEILAYSARQVDSGNARWTLNGAGNWNGGGLHYSPDYGFGLVDAHAAVRLAESWSGQAMYSDLVTATAAAAPGIAIPDGAAAGVSSTVSIGAQLDIDRVEVELDISHSWIGDLKVSLISPQGTESVLVNRPGINPDTGSGRGSSADNLNFVLSSNHFWGEASAGVWTLKVSDLAGGETGRLNGWSLKVHGDRDSAADTYVYTDEYALARYAARNTIVDTSGVDTINAAAVSGNSLVNLQPGSTSTIAGSALRIAAGSVIENVLLGDGDDTAIGNAAANNLSGGRGNDTLNGGNGVDRLVGGSGNDFLNGGIGADRMIGGAGDDTYVVDDPGDRIDETIAGTLGGMDLVRSSVGFSLASQPRVENLTLTGSASIQGTGNAQPNVITGNSGANVLDGAGGNDTLRGGDGNDTLIGGAGNDTLIGGNGNDTLIGGAGADKLTGNAGRDVFRYSEIGAADTITDFAKGASGDVLDVADLLHGMGPGSDPFAGGFLEFQAKGNSTLVRVDLDGGGDAYRPLATLSNVVLTVADTANYNVD